MVPGAVTRAQRPPVASARFARAAVVGLTAFLTVVDLFAAQAILPALTQAYGVSPGAMGLAVNASTLGMAAAGLGVALFGRRLDRRRGIVASLVLLAAPTSLLAVAPDLATFAALRVAQGLCMATAFTLTLALLGEGLEAGEAAGTFAAYITGNVASNLFGRLIAAAAANHLGLGPTFALLALLNLAGAALVLACFPVGRPAGQARLAAAAAGGWREHLRDPALLSAFGIGFCILFAFIGVFTYVNFVLVAPPLAIGPMALGLVYLVFLPSIVTTPLAGRAAQHFSARPALVAALALAAAGLPLLVLPALTPVLAGLAVVGVGTFFAQAVATGAVSSLATGDRGSAGGLYLASYFLGGLVGSAVLGEVFERAGWIACVAHVGVALAVAAALALRLDAAGLRASRPR